MAIKINVVNPTRQTLRKLGITADFTSPAVFSSTYTTKDTIKSWLINYLSTYKGERYMNPNLGNDIFLTLFENINDNTNSTLDSLRLKLEREITEKFPEIELTELLFIIDEPNQTLNISFTFKVLSTNETDVLSFNIEL